jgi:hypothetical protein
MSNDDERRINIVHRAHRNRWHISNVSFANHSGVTPPHYRISTFKANN